MFITNCVIKHLWHVVPGGHFERMFGQDLNPHVYKLMPSIADHIHWGGGDWTSSRGGKGVHDAPGGGHAHAGCMVYLGDNWPDEYRGNVFMCNIHGSRINRDFLERKGSTYVAKHGHDFMFANDPWFRGLTLKYGPDGGVFVTDWSDTGECHNYEKVDQTNGRIFKITYGDPKPFRGDLSKLSDLELVKLHNHKNEWFSRHARRILQERAAAGRLDPKAITELRPMYPINSPESVRQSLRSLWTLFVTNNWSPTTLKIAIAPFAELQSWQIRLYLDQNRTGPRPIDANKLGISLSESGPLSPQAKLAFFSAVDVFDLAKRSELLTTVVSPDEVDSSDLHMQLMAWYAFEPVAIAHPKLAVDLLDRYSSGLLREFTARRLSEHLDTEASGFEDLFEWLSFYARSNTSIDVLRGIQTGLAGRKHVPMPKEWPGALKALSASPIEEVRDRAMQLAVLFGDKNALAKLLASVRKRKRRR